MIIFNSYVSHYQRVPCFFGGFLLGCEDPTTTSRTTNRFELQQYGRIKVLGLQTNIG